MWSKIVFWHGYDVMHRPCLIVRLGLACSTLASKDRPRFAQAVGMFFLVIFSHICLLPKDQMFPCLLYLET